MKCCRNLVATDTDDDGATGDRATISKRIVVGNPAKKLSWSYARVMISTYPLMVIW